MIWGELCNDLVSQEKLARYPAVVNDRDFIGVKLNIEITKRLVYYQLKSLERNYLWKVFIVHNLGKI